MLELQQFDASTDHARVSPRNALVGMTGIGSKSTSLLDTGGSSGPSPAAAVAAAAADLR